jgi:hypothetical protein
MHAAYQLFEKACMMIQLWNVHGRLINLQGRLPPHAAVLWRVALGGTFITA